MAIDDQDVMKVDRMGKRRHKAMNSAGHHNPRGRGQNVDHTRWCSAHRKPAYTRKNAKSVIRELSLTGMRERRCTVYDGLYHIEVLPEDVRLGLITLDEFDRRKDQPSAVAV